MKIPLAAITLALTGLSANPLNPPAPRLDASATGSKVVLMPLVELELNPHSVGSEPVPYSTLRENSANSSGARLDRLDDRVSNLKARADLGSLRAYLDEDFERLKILRANVATALLNLRNPAIGLSAAEQAVSNALNELEIAVEALTGKIDKLDLLQPPRVS